MLYRLGRCDIMLLLYTHWWAWGSLGGDVAGYRFYVQRMDPPISAPIIDFDLGCISSPVGHAMKGEVPRRNRALYAG